MEMDWSRSIAKLVEKRAGQSALVVEDFFATPPPGYREEQPALALVGPTGAGKSTLINMLLGFPSLLKEGLDTTTRRPTVMRWAPQWRLQAVGTQRALLTLEHAAIGPYIRPVTRGETDDTLLARLCFDDTAPQSQHLLQGLRYVERHFWDQVRYSGPDEMLYALLEGPFPLLPKGCLLLDIPGFEQGLSKDPTPLELLIRAWLRKCHATLFVVEKGKTRLSAISSWVRHQIERDVPCALYVSWMDKFDALQFGGGKEGLATFRAQLTESYQRQGLPVLSRMPMFFGCARLAPGRGYNGTCGSLPVVQAEAVAETQKLLAWLGETLNALPSLARQRQDILRQALADTLQQLEQRLHTSFDQARDTLQSYLLDRAFGRRLQERVEEIIDGLDISLLEIGFEMGLSVLGSILFDEPGDDPAFLDELAEGLRRNVVPLLQDRLREGVTSYNAHLRQTFESEFLQLRHALSHVEMHIPDVDHYIGTMVEDTKNVLLYGEFGDGLGDDVDHVLGELFACIDLVMTTLEQVMDDFLDELHFSSPASVIKERLKAQLLPRFAPDTGVLAQLWSASTNSERSYPGLEQLTAGTFQSLWYGTGPEGSAVYDKDGKRWLGLKTTLVQSLGV